jgi:peptidoglycan/xylan/chitin deacetylase (PgdA/CDA1 family)
MRWPGRRHVAVVLDVAYEVWAQGQVSGVGPMGNPLPAGIFDTNADSYGRYGAADGIRRLMRKLEQAHATADIFTSGALAEREPQLVKAIADGTNAKCRLALKLSAFWGRLSFGLQY